MARRKPHDPAAAAKAAAERAEIKAEIERLKASGATVTVDVRGRIVSAYRSNVFNLLLKRGTIRQEHHNHAMTLAATWAAWKGLDGKPESFGEFVDGGGGCAELITDRMLAAGRLIYGGDRVTGALQHAPPGARKLLEAFMVATVEEDRPMAWRGVVERVCGPLSREAQTRAVVDALEGLRVFYEAPRAERRAA